MASLFVERMFCRFLCPLGGALAILGRLHMFRWLKRRPECGSACHICESSCPVQAIPRGGRINMNECFQCLDCQVDYYDETTCPPLVARRKRRARPPRRRRRLTPRQGRLSPAMAFGKVLYCIVRDIR